MLGGTSCQTYLIKEAIKMGYYVITCDYLPDNPGHQFAHEYHNVSTTDKEAVLQLAKGLEVDAVVSYASDPAAPVAAYVCEQLGLPTSPYDSVLIFSEKDLFRKFLTENGFNVPKAKGYLTYEDALADIDTFQLPVMVKPVDSSGSKGVNMMTHKKQLKQFVEDALSYSRKKRIIIEEFIEKQGSQISGDMFSVDGKIVFWSFGNEFYSNNGIKEYVPLGEFWPLLTDKNIEQQLIADLQRLVSLLKMKSCEYNVEAIVGKDNKIYLLDIGARSGGSLIPQIIERATGVNLVQYVIKAALGEDCSSLHQVEGKGYWSNYMLHSKETGIFDHFWFDDDFAKNNFCEMVAEVKQGDQIHAFRNSGDALGTMIIKYESIEEMQDKISHMDDFVKVSTKIT